MRGAVSRKGWVLFAVMGLVWGIPYLFIKVAVGQVFRPRGGVRPTAIGALLLLPGGALCSSGRGELDALAALAGRSSLRRAWRCISAQRADRRRANTTTGRKPARPRP